jgi:hypothetical protein
MDKGFIRSIILSLASSLTLGGWLLLSMKAISTYPALDYYILMSFFAFIFLMVWQALRNKPISRPKPRVIVNGVLFAAELMIFLSIVNSQNIVMLSALITLNIIVFTIINIFLHKEVINKHIAIRITVSALLIIAAVDLIYGLNESTGFTALTQADFYMAFLLVIIFGITNYMFSYNSKRVVNEENFIFWILLSGFTFSMLLFAAIGSGLDVERGLIYYAMAGGMLMFAGISSMAYGYRYLAYYKNVMRFVGTNVLFLLSEMDVIFIAILYSIFIDAISSYVLGAIALILFSMVVISTIEDRRSQTNIFTHIVANAVEKEAEQLGIMLRPHRMAQRRGRRRNRAHKRNE